MKTVEFTLEDGKEVFNIVQAENDLENKIVLKLCELAHKLEIYKNPKINNFSGSILPDYKDGEIRMCFFHNQTEGK